MALTLQFADSFAHYQDTSIKWSTGGGVFETDPAHVRTGPQSLRIQAGDSPSLTNFAFPVDTAAAFPTRLAAYTIGFAWQTSVLGGETIFKTIATFDAGGSPISPQTQLQLVQNADGSLSVFTGNSPTLVGSTAAGVLTVGPFWYIEFTADQSGGTLSITVTDVLGVASSVLNLTGVVTSLVLVNQFEWGGPSGLNSAWVADFYLARWNTADPSNYGAPQIYGTVAPISPDGFGRLNNGPDPAPFNVTSPPWFPQVNTVPDDTSTFIARADDNPVPGLFPSTLGQGFVYDISSVPGGSTIAAIQATHLWSKGHDISGNAPTSVVYMAFSGDPTSFIFSGSKGDSLVDSPFLFWAFGFDSNPLTSAPWDLGDFTGPTAQQIGPGVISLG